MPHQFNSVDQTQMRLLGQLSPAQRLRAMLDAREMAVSLKRGRLRRRYPDLSAQEINLKLLEELDPSFSADAAGLWTVIQTAARREADHQ